MIWERRAREVESKEAQAGSAVLEEKMLMSKAEAVVTLDPPKAIELENPIFQNGNTATILPPMYHSQTALGRSVVVVGELSGNEDFLIEGEFAGNINLQDRCLTVGSCGRVRAEIQAREVIVFGTIDGKITARDKIDLRKTSHVVGDLVSAAVAMEEGAYVKGTIEILRDETPSEAERPLSGAEAVLVKSAGTT